MKRSITFCLMITLFICLLISSGVFAQDFTRSLEIPVPETNLNNGGTGAMISGVDIDGDGLLEIYLINDNWNDGATEVIPRIYKLEQNGANWDVVWSAVAPVAYQNTWPTLSISDLDKDGKPELLWGVVNSTGIEANPYRIVVYESAGDGSDVMGVATADTNVSSGEDLKYAPNAKWTICDANDVNMRIMDWKIADPDNDGTDEIIFADRKGNNGGYYFGVCSVSDIPDNGDGSETWTLEVSGKDFGDLTAQPIENKWDVAVIGNNCYFFCEVEVSKLSWDGSAWNYTALSPLEAGSPNQSAEALDLDGDGTEEIILAIYDWGNDDKKGIYLLQEDGDTLIHTELVNMSEYWTSRGAWGSAMGDIDQDGYMDFVFGSRGGEVNANIFRFAYRGGDITDPANYELTVIDSNYAEAGIWSVINIANIDTDPELEVLYTSSTDAGTFPNLGTKPIVVLDYTGSTVLEFDNLIVAPEVLLNGATPSGLLFKPGRILDANTIWFCGVDGSNRQTYVFRSVDGGATFTHNATPIDGRAGQMDAFDANTALVATANGKIYKTTDGGVNWTEVYSYMISVIAPGWFDGCRVLNDNVAVAFGDMEPNGAMHFVRTEDKGDTWTEITGIDYLGAAYGYYTWGLASCNVGESIWCAATNMEYDSSFVFRSNDAGVTWESFKIPKDVIATYPRAIVFTDDNNGMIADRRGNVVKSTDGGATWAVTNKPDTASSSWVNGVVAIPNTNIIVAMDDIGVYYTTDLGATWGKMNTPTETDADYFVSGVFLNNNFGYFFTDGGLVLRFENQLTGISERHHENIPADFHISQNYPNPFNPTTTINYYLPTNKRISLKVYNSLGQEIKTLVNGEIKQKGHHKIQWDATDNAGNRVASGMYIYTLKYGNFQVSKRMTLLK